MYSTSSTNAIASLNLSSSSAYYNLALFIFLWKDLCLFLKLVKFKKLFLKLVISYGT